MKVFLHDFQEGSKGLFDGVQVDDPERLHCILDQLQQREPFIMELEGDNGYRLTVGIGGPVSSIQHASNDGEPPYLVAIVKNPEPGHNQSDHVFLCGDQATEIPGNRCVPFAVLQSVARHFIQTGERSVEVDWVQV